jgi:glycine dehydrogenase subunit 1
LDQWTGDGLLQTAFTASTFKEFVVRVPGGKLDNLLSAAAEQGIMAGVPLGCWYPELEDCLLVAVTEKRTKAEIDRMTQVVRSVLS